MSTIALERMGRLDAHLADSRCFDGQTALLRRHHASSQQQRELQHEESISEMLWKVVGCCHFGHCRQLSMLVSSQLKQVTIRINTACSCGHEEQSQPSPVPQDSKSMTTRHQPSLHSIMFDLFLFRAPLKRRA
jgi:hypothetical protein